MNLQKKMRMNVISVNQQIAEVMNRQNRHNRLYSQGRCKLPQWGLGGAPAETELGTF